MGGAGSMGGWGWEYGWVGLGACVGGAGSIGWVGLGAWVGGAGEGAWVVGLGREHGWVGRAGLEVYHRAT